MEPFSQIMVPTILALNKMMNPRIGGFQNVPLGWSGRQPVYEPPLRSELGQDAGNLMMNVFQSLISEGMNSAAQNEFSQGLQEATPASFATGGGALNASGPYGAPTQLAPVTINRGTPDIMRLVTNPRMQSNPYLEPYLQNMARVEQIRKMQQPDISFAAPGTTAVDTRTGTPLYTVPDRTPKPQKPESRLLRSPLENVPGVGRVPVDYYGYTDESGKEVVTERKWGPHANATGANQLSENDLEATAELVAKYKAPLSQLSRTGGFREKVLARAKQLNPKLDIKQYDMNQKLINSYTSGKASDNLVSLATVAKHMGQLDSAITALNNGDIATLNLFAKMYGQETGDSAYDVFETVRNAVANEMATALKGAAGTDIGLREALSSYMTKRSPQILRGVNRANAGIVKSRIESQVNRYKSLTGENPPTLDEDAMKLLGGLTTVGSVQGIPSDEEIDKMTPEQLKAYLEGK